MNNMFNTLPAIYGCDYQSSRSIKEEAQEIIDRMQYVYLQTDGKMHFESIPGMENQIMTMAYLLLGRVVKE